MQRTDLASGTGSFGTGKSVGKDANSELPSHSKRFVVGLMSGTSLDGVDVAIAEIKGSGTSLSIKTRAFASQPYDEKLKQRILRNSIPDTSSVAEICTLNVELAYVYAAAIKKTCSRFAISLEDIGLIGSHGQTIYHDPSPAKLPAATLQIGDPATLAHLIGIPVVGDFRMGDMALGGEGAPLVPYVDWAVFSSPDENRVLLNLGGIANISALSAGCKRSDVVAFDTGPANMLIDGLMQQFTGAWFDKNGAFAASGVVSDSLLKEWLQHPYFELPPPKSTGRELFNAAFVQQMVAQGRERGLSDQDIVATATAFTVQSILDALSKHVDFQVDRVIVSGGGSHNETLMNGLGLGLPHAHVDSATQHGFDSDAKEALCFAVLAHEAMGGVATGMPSVTGARGCAFSGKICLPGK